MHKNICVTQMCVCVYIYIAIFFSLQETTCSSELGLHLNAGKNILSVKNLWIRIYS